jgi:hypothetical protein
MAKRKQIDLKEIQNKYPISFGNFLILPKTLKKIGIGLAIGFFLGLIFELDLKKFLFLETIMLILTVAFLYDQEYKKNYTLYPKEKEEETILSKLIMFFDNFKQG